MGFYGSPLSGILTFKRSDENPFPSSPTCRSTACWWRNRRALPRARTQARGSATSRPRSPHYRGDAGRGQERECRGGWRGGRPGTSSRCSTGCRSGGGMIRVTVLGCGGSLGVPDGRGNDWGDCDPGNPRNRRRRPAILVETRATTGWSTRRPTCATTAVRHRAGTDRRGPVHPCPCRPHPRHRRPPALCLRPGADFQPMPTRRRSGTSTTASAYAVDSVEMDRGLYRPILTIQEIDGPFTVGDLGVRPFVPGPRLRPLARLPGLADIAYSTDVASLDDKAFEALKGRSVLDRRRHAPPAASEPFPIWNRRCTGSSGSGRSGRG